MKKENSLKNVINQYYLESQTDRKRTHFYASEMGKCPRQMFYSFKDVPKKELTANVLRLFDMGNHVHQMITKAMILAKDIEVIATEINIPPQELVAGRLDAIFKMNDELFVLDIKSINGRAFSYLKEAKEDNVLQIQLYLYYFKIKKGILLYVDKDTLRMKEFIMEYDEKVAKDIIKKLEILRKQIDNNEMPDRIAEYPKHWKCKYCSYSNVCKITNDKLNPGAK